MLIINYSYPLKSDQRAQIEELTGEEIREVRDIPAQFDHAQPFSEQIRDLVDSIGLAPEEWQTMPILINPPSYNFAALTLVAELHGRMGYFPPVIRLRPVEKSTLTHFEVAEIINLQVVRDTARSRR